MSARPVRKVRYNDHACLVQEFEEPAAEHMGYWCFLVDGQPAQPTRQRGHILTPSSRRRLEAASHSTHINEWAQNDGYRWLPQSFTYRPYWPTPRFIEYQRRVAAVNGWDPSEMIGL